MQRLVVDTNCLLASINPRGAYFKLYEIYCQGIRVGAQQRDSDGV